MNNVIIMSSAQELQNHFSRCCNEYDYLEMYVAWVGNPHNIVPFHFLEKLNFVKAYIGIAFDQTNPDGIERLLEKKYTVSIVNSKVTYHPKVYYFHSKSNSALIVGSSNFTYSGYSSNIEANVLIEGKENQDAITEYIIQLRNDVSKLPKVKPTISWLNDYRSKYEKRQDKLKKDKIKDEAIYEDNLANNDSWLATATFDIYLKKIQNGLKSFKAKYGENLDKKIEQLNEYKIELPIPWDPSLFDSIENRRRITGISPYGWLGHIGASGDVRRLFANGSAKEKKAICSSVNTIAKLEFPIDYNSLKKELNKLVAIGPSIKAWGRILAITRPDLFCTISAPSVRINLSNLLEIPQTYFHSVDGYIDLLKLIHNSPWFNAKRPSNKIEVEIWKKRVAFLDILFY